MATDDDLAAEWEAMGDEDEGDEEEEGGGRSPRSASQRHQYHRAAVQGSHTRYRRQLLDVAGSRMFENSEVRV